MTPSQESFCNVVRLSYGTAFEDADPRRVHGLARMGRASGLSPDQLHTLFRDVGAPDVEARVAIDAAFRIPEHELRARITAAIEATLAGEDGGDGRNKDANGVDDADRAVFAMIRVMGED